MIDTEPRPDGLYSWVVVSACTVGMIFTLGNPFSYGVLLTPFSETFGIPRVLFSTVFALELLGYYIGAGVIAILATRLPPRRVLFTTGLVMIVLSPSLFVVGSYRGILAVFIPLGIAIGVAYVFFVSIVPQWFQQRRGTATGILFVGNGLSLTILPPGWRLAIDRFGVPTAFFIVILLSGVAFLGASTVCKRPPWRDTTQATLPELGRWIVDIARTRSSFLLFLGIALSFGPFFLLAGFAIELFVDRGLSVTLASTGFGAIGGVSIGARLASGAIADRLGFVETYLISLVVVIIGTCLLLFRPLPSLVLAVVFLGIGLGGIATLYAPVLIQAFDPGKDTAIMGTANLGFGVVAFAAPPVGTVLIERTGSFEAAILLTLALTVVGIVAIWYGSTADSG